MHRQPTGCIGICLVVSFAFTQNVRADPITFNFSGPVHQRSGNAPQAVGDTLIGSFTVDPQQLTTTEQGASFRRFEGPIDLHLAFKRPSSGTAVVEYDLSRLHLVINNDIEGSGTDAFRPLMFNDPVRPALVFGFFFTDRTGDALTSTDFPSTLNLPAFDEFRLFFGTFFEGAEPDLRPVGTFTGVVTSLNGLQAPDVPSPTPEPASWLLVGTAGMLIVKNRRNARARRSLEKLQSRPDAFTEAHL